jgi:hypothetical protein
MRLEVPVEQRDWRTRPLLAEDLQVLVLAERLSCLLRQVSAEDHRAGADADIDLRLHGGRHLRGEVIDDDAGKMVVIAACGVDDIGMPESFEGRLPGQAVQFQNVEFPPAQTVQSAQVFDEPAVIARDRARGRRDERHRCLCERLADQVGERGLEGVVSETGRRQQRPPHASESSPRGFRAWTGR